MLLVFLYFHLLQVIFATGYVFSFPFLDKRVVDVHNNRLPFYKYMFPPDLKHGTLAVIGCVKPNGAFMPISEIQCRLAARVFNVSDEISTLYRGMKLSI